MTKGMVTCLCASQSLKNKQVEKDYALDLAMVRGRNLSSVWLTWQVSGGRAHMWGGVTGYEK